MYKIVLPSIVFGLVLGATAVSVISPEAPALGGVAQAATIEIGTEGGVPAERLPVKLSVPSTEVVYSGNLMSLEGQINDLDQQIAMLQSKRAELLDIQTRIKAEFVKKGVNDTTKPVIEAAATSTE